MARFNVIKMSVHPKLIYGFNAIPIKVQVCVIDIKKKAYSKIYVGTGPGIAKTAMKSEAGGITLPDMKAYAVATE